MGLAITAAKNSGMIKRIERGLEFINELVILSLVLGWGT
jgi:hypothetical protein